MRIRTHPGEALREEFVKPYELSAWELAEHLGVPANREHRPLSCSTNPSTVRHAASKCIQRHQACPFRKQGSLNSASRSGSEFRCWAVQLPYVDRATPPTAERHISTDLETPAAPKRRAHRQLRCS